MTADAIGVARRWSILGLALTATMCANVFINGVAFLIPTLHSDHDLDLAHAGLLSSLPSFDMVATFRAAVASAAGSLTATGAFLLLGGMAAASSNSASGRLVMGRFPAHQRGLALGSGRPRSRGESGWAPW